jgi:hypothetical protein
MKMRIALVATMLTALPMLAANGGAQTPRVASTLTIAGHSGEATLLQINGKSYVEVETLARLTKGTLSFKANQTTLTLPPSVAEVQASAPHVKAGFSTAFVHAGVEEMSAVREWRTTIVNAVQKNTPVSEDWVLAQRRLADKNLALASAAVSTDDDRNAYPLLSAELSNMQKLSDLYLAMRTQVDFISTDTFHSSPLEDQILSCAQGFASMTEKHEFQDQPACR